MCYNSPVAMCSVQRFHYEIHNNAFPPHYAREIWKLHNNHSSGFREGLGGRGLFWVKKKKWQKEEKPAGK